MAQRYNPKEIEPKWQKIWSDSQLYHVEVDSDRQKSYVMEMFPYPSGEGLHVGHVRNYTISDTIAQHERQKGKNVLHTIGWDAFGLPAENYAIKTGTPPAESIKQNIANFKLQLQRLGMSYDWSREINTTDPKYYRWTQWVFLQLFRKNLAYQAERQQWWCPHDKTVLANEQVENGRCWRCGHEVVKKTLNQWFFKITDYADQLLDGLDDLEWPEKIVTQQRNWIGKSVGAEVSFKIKDSDKKIEVFTTRPDTLFGATFLVLAPEHELVGELTTAEQSKAVADYKAEILDKSDVERMNTDREKTGVFTGSYGINPVNDEQIPIWIADYVLTGYGTGAIMAVPGHDERDHAFATKYQLPIREVVEPLLGVEQDDPEFRRSIVAIVRNPKDNTFLSVDWGSKLGGSLFIGGGIDGEEDVVETARREVAEETGYTNLKLIAQTGRVHHRYYAYSKSKGRYIHCWGLLFDLVDDTKQEVKPESDEKGKFTVQWLSESDAESKVSEDLHAFFFQNLVRGKLFTGEGLMVNSGAYDDMPSSEAREKIVADLNSRGEGQEKVNYRMHDWLISRQRYWGVPIPIIHCPDHGAVAVPEDQLPVVLPPVKSYLPTGEGTSVLAGVSEWVNTTCPECGKPAKRETDTMDGYACSSWYFLRYTDATNDTRAWDPAKANYWMPIDFYCGGDHAVSHLLYSRFWMHFFADLGLIDKSKREPVKRLVYNGYINAAGGAKMSKSKGNVVNPNELIDQGYGADSLRLFELFIAPYEEDTSWNTNGVAGCYRFLQRVWVLADDLKASDAASDDAAEKQLRVATHRTIKKVSEDLDRLNFNTAIAALMEFVNDLYKIKAEHGFGAKSAWNDALAALTQLLGPLAPHITEELWSLQGKDGSVHTSGWPTWDDSYLVQDTMNIAVQVNGKLRAQLSLGVGADEQAVLAAAKADQKVAAHLEGKQVVKTIYVPGKILNLVVR